MNNVLKYYVRIFMLLFPIFFLPVFTDGFGVGKNWFFLMSALLGLVLWILNMFIAQDFKIKSSKVLFLALLFGTWASASYLRMGMGVQMRSLTDPLGYGTILAAIIWLFLWLQVTNEEEYDKQFMFLNIAGILSAVLSLAVFLIPGSKLPLMLPNKDNPLISIGEGWSLTGSLVNEMVLLLFLAVEWGRRLSAKLKNKESNFIPQAIGTAFLGLILALDAYKLFKLGWAVLDFSSAWVIATESLKRYPVWGVGVGNFLQGFYNLRPASYNLGKYWSSAFSGSSMGLLHVWTELGIIGLILLVWFASMWLRQKGKKDFWQVGVLVLLLLFTPLTMMTLFLLAWMSASKLFATSENKLILNVGEKDFNAMPYIVSVIFGAGIILTGYWGVRIFLGEMYLRQSLVAASKNDGGKTYDLQIKAISSNPRMAEYRKIYSQTNLALAQAILSNEEVSEEDKQKASTLIQQSVREGKAAVELDAMNVNYWSNLAAIYKAVAGVVEGAADWSLQAYQQAVALDPVNPILKLDMGGLLFAANQFDGADRVFEQAVMAKNDYANAWYNWAYTAKKSEKIADAVQRLSQAVTLVPADSGDYEKANKELEEWKKEYDEAVKKYQEQQQQAQAQQQQQQPKKAETLKAPEAMPTVGEEEKVNVSAAELEPPKPQVTPEVSETPTQ